MQNNRNMFVDPYVIDDNLLLLFDVTIVVVGFYYYGKGGRWVEVRVSDYYHCSDIEKKYIYNLEPK